MMSATSIKRVTIKRQLQQFSVQDKLDAIQRVNEGESKASVARDIGVPESTLRGWCKRLCNGGSLEPPQHKRARSEDHLTSGVSSVVGSTSIAGGSSGGGVMGSTSANKDPELDEALWYWLRQQQQHVASMSEQLCAQSAVSKNIAATSSTSSSSSSSAAAVAAAAAAAVAATTGAMVSSAAADLSQGSGWFWRWYKRYGLGATEGVKLNPADSALPLLTSSRASSAATVSTQSSSVVSRTPAPAHTSSATSPLPLPAHAHSTPVPAHVPMHPPLSLQVTPQPLLAHQAPGEEEPSDDEDDEPPLTAAEAVLHGERFLRWLDCCSDPSVTALQILQFRYLLNNVRACAARRAKSSKS